MCPTLASVCPTLTAVCSTRSEGRCKAAWKREFKLPWREAGPPNHHNDGVDWNTELSIKNTLRLTQIAVYPTHIEEDLTPILYFLLTRHSEDDYSSAGSVQFCGRNLSIRSEKRGKRRDTNLDLVLFQRALCKHSRAIIRCHILCVYMPISHKVFLKSFCNRRFPHKSVDLFFMLVIVKKYWTDI